MGVRLKPERCGWTAPAEFETHHGDVPDRDLLPGDIWLPDERPRFGEGGGVAAFARVPAGGDAGGGAMILYNTCSIREKAAQKVFSRLGEYRERRNEGKIIGVLGCVAQQEGEGIFKRAPWVSLVCGSASYRKLPEMLAELEAGNRRVTGLDNDTDETFETEITRRDNPWRAYLTIIEGCDKACAYCVVPHTRGPERSRGQRIDFAGSAAAGGAGIFRSAVAGADGEFVRGSDRARDEIFGIAAGSGGGCGDSAGAIHDFASAGFWRGHRGGDRVASRNFAITCICRCNRGRRECCGRCSGLIRARSIWRRLR